MSCLNVHLYAVGPVLRIRSLVFLRLRPPPRSTLFPYTTLFRSLDGERDVGRILLGDRRCRDLNAGKIQSLVALQIATIEYARLDPRIGDVKRNELDQTVIDQDTIADMDVVRELIVGDRNLTVLFFALVNEHDVLAHLEVDRVGEITDSDARALEVAEDRDRLAGFVGEATHHRDGGRVSLVRAV